MNNTVQTSIHNHNASGTHQKTQPANHSNNGQGN